MVYAISVAAAAVAADVALLVAVVAGEGLLGTLEAAGLGLGAVLGDMAETLAVVALGVAVVSVTVASLGLGAVTGDVAHSLAVVALGAAVGEVFLAAFFLLAGAIPGNVALLVTVVAGDVTLASVAAHVAALVGTVSGNVAWLVTGVACLWLTAHFINYFRLLIFNSERRRCRLPIF